MESEPRAQFDEADNAWMDSFLDEGDIPIGLFAVVAYVDKDGARQTKKYLRWESTYDTVIGALAVEQARLIRDVLGIDDAS